jgi:hypothetical protein
VNKDISELVADLQPKLNTNRSKLRQKLRSMKNSQASEESSAYSGGPGINSSSASKTIPASSLSSQSTSSVHEADIVIQVLPTAVVSGHTGAGVHALWKDLFLAAAEVGAKEGVPIHFSAMRWENSFWKNKKREKKSIERTF